MELAGTPFHPQERYQCGPAALLTVLEASGADVTLPELVGKVYLPAREGSLQVEMLAATRTSGRIPYRIDGSLSALLAELHQGRPVVVLQNLGVAALPRWHYAVVVGFNPEKEDIVLRSGTDERRETPLRTFLHTWRRSEYWAFVTLRPDELPANVDRNRYFSAIAGFESAGQAASAVTAWRTALGKWPQDDVASFGFANALYSAGQLTEAIRAYRELLAINSDLPIVRNNLAMALLDQGKPAEALNQIDQALRQAADPLLLAEFARTRDQIMNSAKD